MAIRRVGTVEKAGAALRLKFPERMRAELQPAIEILRTNKAEALERSTQFGRAIEVWADAAGGRVWIVTDEEDARAVVARRLGHRGETWTAAEIELVARITDPAIQTEVARWKRTLAGAISRCGGQMR